MKLVATGITKNDLLVNTHMCRNHRSVLPVASCQPVTSLRVARQGGREAGERMQIDRFLVLQYEGDLHTLTRPKPSTIAAQTIATHEVIKKPANLTVNGLVVDSGKC
jgi:hypothetical protein